MRSFLRVIIVMVICAIASCDKFKKDYEWIDFDGDMPMNTLLAGIDKRGPIYVGQVLYNGELVPGKLYRNDRNIYFEYGGRAMQSNDNVKVLSTSHPEKFEWLPTTNGDYESIKKAFILKGGHETGFRIYIGRVYEHHETILGKVVCRDTFCLALYGVHDGKPIERYAYQILTYNPHGKVSNKLYP